MTRSHATRSGAPTRALARFSPFLGLLAVSLFSVPAGALVGQSGPSLDAFSDMSARSIGPAGMSGRVADVEVVPGTPGVIFVGAATGGVWRSVDGGLTWEPIFDEQDVLGIGAVAVSPVNPDIVWVGTGEGNPRNSAGVGYGVYKSIDGGDTWEHLGLESTERIHRILPHPTDPDIAYVGAMGPAWSDGEQRGVFKTVDGGRSWEHVLFVNPATGVGDMVMDPRNPDRLLVGMWEFRRWPWFFESGGEGSGLYVTEDGGANWNTLTPADGLPEGELGRMGIAFAPSNPDIVYALVEANQSALLRSEDGGRSWSTISDRPGIAPRPFYYADIRVDSENPDRIYSLHSSIQVSDDQGRSFRTVVSSQIIHGDVHELWIDPDDANTMIMGNDGGIAFTYDRGEHWRFVENLTLAQFYHIEVDMERPFNVYGGLQDNGSWYGPSTVWENRGIMNAHWRRVGGGDGFWVMNDFADPRYGFSQSQGGNLSRFDKVTGNRKSIRPVHPDGLDLRFNWNAALALDPIDSTSIYSGSQFLHRSRDSGGSWEILSPDLTTNDPEKQRWDESGGLTPDGSGAETHTTIITIAPSPLEPGVIWVGTDDGNVQITRDDGGSWTNVVDRIPGVPAGTWVPHIEASTADPARAYAVFEDHRRGDWTPYVFRTDDYGETWTRVGTDGVFGFVHTVIEDPVEPSLLYLGSEFGLFVSFDGGGAWQAWRHGFPAAPVRSLVVHPRDHDLVIGTHGRGVYIVDDIRPLREIAANPGIVAEAVHLFTPPAAFNTMQAEAIGYRSVGHAMQFGEMRATGALLSFWVAGGGSEPVEIDITDSEGTVVRTLTPDAEPGLNRISWNLSDDQNVDVLSGTYRVTARRGSASSEQVIEVHPDPRIQLDRAEEIEKRDAILQTREWLGSFGAVRQGLNELHTAVTRALDGELAGDLATLGQAAASALDGLEIEVEEKGSDVQGPLRSLGSTPYAPTGQERLLIERAWSATSSVVERFNRILGDEVEAFHQALEAAGLRGLPEVGAVAPPTR